MLCRICEDCIRNAESLAVSNERALSPHHFSFISFYRSIQDECFICRHLWISLQKSQGVDEHDQQLIPQTLEHFYYMAPSWQILGRHNQALIHLSLQFANSSGGSVTAYNLNFWHELDYIMSLTLNPVSPYQTFPRITNNNPNPVYTGDMIQLWCKWFRTCCETHPCCQKIEQRLQTFTPQRLIQLLPNDHGVISRWQLVSFTTPGIPYLTLSHC
ncbi:hypothetical protein F4679DRAFT_568350 [Xylaria curta]|nr:hypothetical protein F4679DRAFT_568350 [Xylaria curta]